MNHLFQRVAGLFLADSKDTLASGEKPRIDSEVSQDERNTESGECLADEHELDPGGYSLESDHRPPNDLNPGSKVMEPVSVIISPPAFDLDPYESFDEAFLQRTVDEILSGRASFESNFDEYAGSNMMDGSSESKSAIGLGRDTMGSPVQRSPYFEKKFGRVVSIAKRNISKMATDDESDSDEESDGDFYVDARERGSPTKSLRSMDSVSLGVVEHSDARFDIVQETETENKSGPVAKDKVIPADDDIAEEDRIFASVDDSERERLIGLFATHPFLSKLEYPVKRSARRKFVKEIRKEATLSGMDQANIPGMVRWVKNTFLELCGIENVNPEASEFGDEINDELPDRAQERKRKRSSLKQSIEEHRNKRRSPMTPEPSDAIPASNQETHVYVDHDGRDSAVVVSRSHSPRTEALEKTHTPNIETQHAPCDMEIVQSAASAHIPSVQNPTDSDTDDARCPAPLPLENHHHDLVQDVISSKDADGTSVQEHSLDSSFAKSINLPVPELRDLFPAPASDTSYDMEKRERSRPKKRRRRNKKGRQSSNECDKDDTPIPCTNKEHSAENTTNTPTGATIDDSFWDLGDF
ncbi:hypothetical protein BDV25DRAFT_54531 [Aspergillus avenaceus]|uniref:Uncharacterized protein n=1 Tax=Aspergillus avenaceus TaxID=36643 RepID=A0A5N6TIQ5_ASPAV|nr:hypothetical protein BDV25DRAFT_54531 [Aspergillus avenaceus]